MKKIVFYGDSITDASRVKEAQGAMNSTAYGYGYVLQIAGRILAEKPNDYHIINTGISGNRICDLYARIKKDVWNYEPDVLSILVGVNDVWHEITYQNGVDIERFEKLYDMLLEDTKKVLPNTKIIILEPFVLKGTATAGRYERYLEVRDYAKVVEKVAKKHNAYFIKLQEKFDKKAEEYGVEPYLVDGVHPNTAGATLIAEEWIKCAKENNII